MFLARPINEIFCFFLHPGAACAYIAHAGGAEVVFCSYFEEISAFKKKRDAKRSHCRVGLSEWLTCAATFSTGTAKDQRACM